MSKKQNLLPHSNLNRHFSLTIIHLEKRKSDFTILHALLIVCGCQMKSYKSCLRHVFYGKLLYALVISCRLAFPTNNLSRNCMHSSIIATPKKQTEVYTIIAINRIFLITTHSLNNRIEQPYFRSIIFFLICINKLY